MHIDLRALSYYRDNFIHIAQIKLGIDALAVEVHRHDNDIHIARTLTISEQRSLDSLCTGHHGKFRRTDSTGAVIVCVQAHNNRITLFDMTTEPFYLVGIDVGRRHFDCRGEIENYFLLRRWLPDIRNGIAHLNSKIDFGASEALGRILECPISLRR